MGGTHGFWNADKIAQIKKMKGDGKTWSEIAATFGRTSGAVQQAWSKRNSYKVRMGLTPVRKYTKRPESVAFEIPEPTKTGQIAIVLIQPNQLKQVMEDLWR